MDWSEGCISGSIIANIVKPFEVRSVISSESYGGSYAETYFGVVDAPQPTAAPDPTPAPMTDTYVLGMGAAGLAAIVVIGLVLIMMMRKK